MTKVFSFGEQVLIDIDKKKTKIRTQQCIVEESRVFSWENKI